MTATTTSAKAARAKPAPANGQPRTRRAWAPDAQDHLIYQMVKFQGKTQYWVSRLFQVSQTTISRIVERYERWQAHAAEREGGRLDRAERLRAQRWLTYERNEIFLASAIRMAGAMEEQHGEVSQSIKSRPLGDPCAQKEIRDVHSTIDRSGIAARFLRLAFKINMEQLQLVELDPPQKPAPLTEDQIAEEEIAAAASTEEFASKEHRKRLERPWAMIDPPPEEARWGYDEEENSDPVSVEQASGERDEQASGERQLPAGSDPPVEPDLASGERQLPDGADAPVEPDHREADASRSPRTRSPGKRASRSANGRTRSSNSVHKLHNLHNGSPPENGASASPPCTSAPACSAEKNVERTCITGGQAVAWPPEEAPRSKKRRAAASARSD